MCVQWVLASIRVVLCLYSACDLHGYDLKAHPEGGGSLQMMSFCWFHQAVTFTVTGVAWSQM